jgi:Holliday junction resolvase
MVKSNEFFSSNYKQSENTEETIKNLLITEGFKIIPFDIHSEFQKCNDCCPIQVNHCGINMPYARYVLFKQISRPDLLINFKKPILLEIKHKNKKYLWVNKRDYDDYIKWEEILGIPIFIVMYVKNEDCYYLHRLKLKTNTLKMFRTTHDLNEVFDLENEIIKLESINKLIDFLKNI